MKRPCVVCDYCRRPAALVTGADIYGGGRGDLAKLRFWLCRPCGSWVGTHKDSPTHEPLGRLANAELRRWKAHAHLAFDPLWKSGRMTRKEAYAHLAKVMGLNVKRAHIGMFTIEQCRQLIEALAKETVG